MCSKNENGMIEDDDLMHLRANEAQYDLVPGREEFYSVGVNANLLSNGMTADKFRKMFSI